MPNSHKKLTIIIIGLSPAAAVALAIIAYLLVTGNDSMITPSESKSTESS